MTAQGWGSPNDIAFDAQGRLYVANSGQNLVIFAAAASGNASPIATIAGANLHPTGIALDLTGRLYVTNTQPHPPYSPGLSSITVYAAGATGNAPPIATISHELDGPQGIAVDVSGVIYVANNFSFGITIFRPDGTWAVINGLNTGLTHPIAISF